MPEPTPPPADPSPHNLIRIGYDPVSQSWTATIDAGDFTRQSVASAPITALLGLVASPIRAGVVDPDWRPSRA